MPPPGGRFRWVRDGWAADRWLFVAVCAVAASCALSMSIGFIVMLVNDPPPAAVRMLVGVYALIELWRRHACRDEPDNDEVDIVDAGWEFMSA
ncbi:hypothetical protein FZI94_23110 [Mycobacterium sp. CBMA226]|nr:hypothetical protein [Mycolicibacterium sp. CBMA 226]